MIFTYFMLFLIPLNTEWRQNMWFFMKYELPCLVMKLVQHLYQNNVNSHLWHSCVQGYRWIRKGETWVFGRNFSRTRSGGDAATKCASHDKAASLLLKENVLKIEKVIQFGLFKVNEQKTNFQTEGKFLTYIW